MFARYILQATPRGEHMDVAFALPGPYGGNILAHVSRMLDPRPMRVLLFRKACGFPLTEIQGDEICLA